MKPLARLYLTRQRLYEKTCEEDPPVSNGKLVIVSTVLKTANILD